ncbi:hypothetical protein CEXT_388461 [Caerostris extrusa]|uniref:Uncharacterized protein n=1 Tax=Caerostris extrusa TaxID=172846 RepID=A0AAV4WAG6_CAEEX|nr:hypothetical protein CEXT_388461 [Caerostris extrusa]
MFLNEQRGRERADDKRNHLRTEMTPGTSWRSRGLPLVRLPVACCATPLWRDAANDFPVKRLMSHIDSNRNKAWASGLKKKHGVCAGCGPSQQVPTLTGEQPPTASDIFTT